MQFEDFGNFNLNNRYYIINQHNKLIEKFRNLTTARDWMSHLKKIYVGEDLKIIKKEEWKKMQDDN